MLSRSKSPRREDSKLFRRKLFCVINVNICDERKLRVSESRKAMRVSKRIRFNIKMREPEALTFALEHLKLTT